MVGISKEWCVKAPWGNIACVSWGQPHQEPVLMVHGFLDSAATFIPILERLPEHYYYVAVDLPGHGKSDAFPAGPLVSHGHQVHALHCVVHHLKWDTFVYVAHSFGFIVGVIYNCVYPFKIKKSVYFDSLPALTTYCAYDYSPSIWHQYHFDYYYKNYKRWNFSRAKKYTYEEAIQLLVRSRHLTKEQSAVVLSRTLVPLGDGMYRLSRDPSMKRIVILPLNEDTLFHIITSNTPPTLNFVASRPFGNMIKPLEKRGAKLMKRLQESIPNFFVDNVTGTHDVHITNPELFVDRIADFLNTDFETSVKAKL